MVSPEDPEHASAVSPTHPSPMPSYPASIVPHWDDCSLLTGFLLSYLLYVVCSPFLCSEPSRDSLLTQSKNQSHHSGPQCFLMRLSSPPTCLCSSHIERPAGPSVHQADAHLMTFVLASPFAPVLVPSQLSSWFIPHSRLYPAVSFS